MQTISRCLDSLRPIMEAIPCELILIDTSKNEEIHRLLLGYTDQVYTFEWCNDFAKARNEGLKRARGEWFLFLDDDEWFVETEALIEFFQSGEYHQYEYANYPVRNFKDSEYTYYDDCWLTRMFQIESDTKFVRKIHEQFIPVRGTQKDLQVLVHHSGYIYESLDDRRRHFERNCVLLKEMVKEEPNNLYWLLQLAQEYSYVGEHENLVAHCKECLQKIADIDEPHINSQRGTFYTGIVTGYLRLKQYDKSVKYALEALRDKRADQVLEAMMHLRLAENYLALKRETLAIKEVEIYLKLVEAPIKEEKLQVFLAGEAFSKNSKEIAYAVFICSELSLGRTSALKEYYSELGWDQPVVYTMENIEKYFVDTMYTMQYERIFAQIMLDVLCKSNLRLAFINEILSRTEPDANTFAALVYQLACAIQNVIDGPQENDLITYLQTMQKYVQAVCQWCDFIESENGLHLETDETPGYLLAAINISDYLGFEEQDTIEALGKLKEAVAAYPEFAEGIGGFLDAYSELEKQRVEQQEKEMENLRTQVIVQVRAMIAAGQNEAAMQIIGQLQQMFPEDSEVETLALDMGIKKA